MALPVEAVLFDMGGTLRKTILRGDEEKKQKVGQIIKLLGAGLPASEFAQLLTGRSKSYKKWAEETEVELNEVDLWTGWMLPDFPTEQVTGLAIQLNEIWREAVSQYVVVPEAREVVLALFRRGYRLGLISNTTSSLEVPRTLEELEISGCFEVVILSCVIGKRKPDPQVLLEATRRMGIAPGRCAYVGDVPRRDVSASRRAGFASSIIISDSPGPGYPPGEPALKPDAVVRDLRGLLAFFPARTETHMSVYPAGNGKTARSAPVLDASLSTMWAMRNFPTLEDFFKMARRFGFANVELNHQVNSRMLAGIDLNQVHFSSIHEPCPADISADTLKTRDWLISSTDEERRSLGVKAIENSIRMAKELGAQAVVIHAGTVNGGWSDEKLLYERYFAGQVGSPEYRQIQQRLLDTREALAKPHLEAVKKSLVELLAVAEPLGIRLGLENRYHYREIPSLDELQELLDLAGPDRIGFWYDVGHAQVLDRLGFFRHEDWLERYGPRILGVHLHDVDGIRDHCAPGQGQVDFERIARYIPAEAIRTFELKPSTSPEQVKNGLLFLAEKGLLKCL